MPTTSRLVSINTSPNQGSSSWTVVPIRTEAGEHIATFHALSARDIDDIALLRVLTQWRRMYTKMFMTQFTATVDRTREWLTELTANDSRVMFLIRGPRGQLLGQYGLRWHGETMELDNGILGSSTGPAALFYHAERTILGWGFETLGTRLAIARVFSKNVFAIKLHKRIGMMAVRREPLVLEMASRGERHYHTAAPGTETDVPFELVTLEISRAAFFASLARRASP